MHFLVKFDFRDFARKLSNKEVGVLEDSTDQDYYINQTQLEQFEKNGGDKTLIQMLRDALGTKDGMDIVWTKS